MAFRDITIKNLEAQNGRYEKWEGGNRGFGIRVYPSGTKAWIYRYRIDGKRKNIILGQYPTMSLKDAHAEHTIKEVLVNKGIDPSRLKKEQIQSEIEAPTVDDLVKRYLKAPWDKKNKPLRPKTVNEYTRLFENDLLPAIGWMKAKDVKRFYIRNAIEKVEERAKNAARQLFKVTRRLFNYAVAKDIIETSPMTGMEVMGTEGKKDRNLSPDEIKIFWQGITKANISEDVKRALKLILVTAQRPGEVIGAHSNEIAGDWWTIPKERSKNKKPHNVFLTPLAKELLEVDQHDGYLFPTRLKEHDKPIAVNALSKAL
jgi:integrase